MSSLDETPVLEAHSPPRRRRAWWVRCLRVAIVGYIVWCGVLYFAQDRMLFHPEMAARTSVEPANPRSVVMRINPGTDQVCESWFIPAPDVDEKHHGPLVVFMHGNAEIIDGQDSIVRGYHAMGVSVLLPEYRGYGRSGGRPGESGIVADMVQFYDEMLRSPLVDRQRVVLHGRSLGGGVAAQLAARRPARALILESTFTSVAVMSHRYGAPSFIVTNPFRTDRVIGGFEFPILIFHGLIDSIVPVEQARTLSGLAQRATYVEYAGVGHELPGPQYWDDYWQQIRSFLSNAGVTQTSVRRRPLTTLRCSCVPGSRRSRLHGQTRLRWWLVECSWYKLHQEDNKPCLIPQHAGLYFRLQD